MKWICPSVQKTSCTEHHHFNYRLMEHIVQKDTFISWSLPCVPTIGKWQLSTALDFKQMLLTDTWDYHWGAEGVIRHTGNICDLSDQASHQRALAGSICIANIHYATQTQWWALKLKTKCWKFFKGGMSRMARNKKITVYLDDIFYIKASLYWVPYDLKMYASLLKIHPLWPNYFILHHKFRWSLV